MNVFLHADDHAHPRVIDCAHILREHGAQVVFGFGYECGEVCVATPTERDFLARSGTPFGEPHTEFRWGDPDQRETLRTTLQGVSSFLSIETRGNRFEFSGSANDAERVEAVRLAADGHLRLFHVGSGLAGSQSGAALLAASVTITIEELAAVLGLRSA